MNTSFIHGVIVPILTPIDEKEKIDERILRRMIDYVIKGGVHGILLFGSNGEFFAVDEEDKKRGLKITLHQVAGRVPVYYGIGDIRTHDAIRHAQIAHANGAQGISVLPPMFIEPSETDLFEFYSAVANAVPTLPVIVYNNPRIGYGITPRLLSRLAHNVKNIVGVKDSSGNISNLAEYIRLTRDVGFKVFAGKDTTILAALAQGAVGCVATTANVVPELVVEIYGKFIGGDLLAAREAQFHLLPIRNCIDLASFPAGTKDLANAGGLNVGRPYLPNNLSDSKIQTFMKYVLSQEGLQEKDM